MWLNLQEAADLVTFSEESIMESIISCVVENKSNVFHEDFQNTASWNINGWTIGELKLDGWAYLPTSYACKKGLPMKWQLLFCCN